MALVLRLGEAALRRAQRSLSGRQAPLQTLALALRGVAHLGARPPTLKAGRWSQEPRAHLPAHPGQAFQPYLESLPAAGLQLNSSARFEHLRGRVTGGSPGADWLLRLPAWAGVEARARARPRGRPRAWTNPWAGPGARLLRGAQVLLQRQAVAAQALGRAHVGAELTAEQVHLALEGLRARARSA